ncbi:MAG: glycosyltransferase family 4 protein [Cyclobacteriaceae bacterium]|nr:glycosyltransferase family 4 protein [Cyclobacteriaceae bacterium]MCH8516914.1 glycosyltransferase family 4 protein [Cyclobacteriaceae bacterium]
MKIIINNSIQRFGGGVQVAVSFIYECIHFSEYEYHVWLGPGTAKSVLTSDFPKNFTFYHFDFGEMGMGKMNLVQKTLAPIEAQIQPDVMICTSGPSYYHSQCPQLMGFNLPLYIYPESPYIQAWSFVKKMKWWLKKQVHFYLFRRDATAFLAQTEDVNQRVRKAFNTEKVHTVTNTHNGFFDQAFEASKLLEKKENGVFRLLSISAFYPHKNLDLIPKVLAELDRIGLVNVEFVLTLQLEIFKKYFPEDCRLINVGPVAPKDCPALYAACDALFLPTLAECFSASYPEAMKMQKPIVTTDLGFARSICGEAALYFEPKNAASAAQEIQKLISDQGLQQDLIAAGHRELKKFDSAQERARKYLELCKQYADK